MSNISKLAYVYKTKIALCLNRKIQIKRKSIYLINVQWINNFI